MPVTSHARGQTPLTVMRNEWQHSKMVQASRSWFKHDQVAQLQIKACWPVVILCKGSLMLLAADMGR